MSAFIDRMTGVYRQYGHYIKKKSEYTLVFFLLMGFYAFFLTHLLNTLITVNG